MESGLELVQLMAADRYIEDLNYDHLPNAKTLPKYAVAKNYAMTVGSVDGVVYNAEKFLDLYLDPELQFEHARATGVVPVQPAAVEKLKSDPENKDVLPFDQIDNLYVVDFTKVNLQRWRTA